MAGWAGDLGVEVDGKSRGATKSAQWREPCRYSRTMASRRSRSAATRNRLRAQADEERGRGEAERRRNEEEHAMVVGTLATSLSRLAQGGDLTTHIEDGVRRQVQPAEDRLLRSCRQPARTMTTISGTTDRIRGGSDEIASASGELSRPHRAAGGKSRGDGCGARPTHLHGEPQRRECPRGVWRRLQCKKDVEKSARSCRTPWLP